MPSLENAWTTTVDGFSLTQAEIEAEGGAQ